ncbi:MAG: hypothetical protein A2068_12605 [Ignavibacteria bacterium GWB2_35_6b]|nr:MAG: hypothetical protein A2068_12605 [Ignavibacteria bacterium GWB2_35_6b]
MSNLIEIEKSEPGMTLAAPILNRYGQVLLPSGVKLIPGHLKMFRTWGIKLITVKGVELEETVISEEMKKKAEEIFSARISWEAKSDFEKSLFEMGVKKILLNLLKKSK